MAERSESFTTIAYRFGFNGKESDNEVSGEGNSYDYGYRINNPRIAKFLSVDPLTKSYPMLTPYQFASNCPISGVDLDGLEYYYAADGKFLGQGSDESNTEVRLGKVSGKTKSGKNLITAVDIEGNKTSLFIVLHGSNEEFKRMAGVLYVESYGQGEDAVNEVAGIYSVLENRSLLEGTSVEAQMTVAKGVYGAKTSEADKINQADAVGMSEKKYAVYAGLIKGIASTEDFSNGAYFWDGKDFNKNANQTGGNRERYKPGYVFNDPSHDLYGQGSNHVQGKTEYGGYWYKYESTNAIGNTTFSRLTDEWRDAQLSGDNKADEMGN